MRFGGIVLCGGRSSRMGQPKAWLPFAGETMLPRVVRLLREAVEPVVVVAAPGQNVPELPGEVAIVRDEVEGKGPLGGLAAGLAALEGKVEAVYLTSCDVPFLKPEFVRRVISILASGGRESPGEFATTGGLTSPARQDVAVPHVGEFFHPLAAAYRVSVLPHVRELLAAERLRPVFLFDLVTTRIIELHELADVDPEFRSLDNVNTPEEYETALREAGLPNATEERP